MGDSVAVTVKPEGVEEHQDVAIKWDIMETVVDVDKPSVVDGVDVVLKIGIVDIVRIAITLVEEMVEWVEQVD